MSKNYSSSFRWEELFQESLRQGFLPWQLSEHKNRSLHWFKRKKKWVQFQDWKWCRSIYTLEKSRYFEVYFYFIFQGKHFLRRVCHFQSKKGWEKKQKNCRELISKLLSHEENRHLRTVLFGCCKNAQDAAI